MALEQRTGLVLQRLLAHPALAGRFINTLSLLEYVGTRKILKSQRAEEIDAILLRHIAEEARHALVLKQLAAKVSPFPLPTYDWPYLIAGAEAIGYFQELDRGVEASLNGAQVFLNYLYTTYLIEMRADLVYPQMEEILASLGRDGIFLRVLREERAHLMEVRRAIGAVDPEAGTRTAHLITLEEQLFERFLGALEEAVRKEPPWVEGATP